MWSEIREKQLKAVNKMRKKSIEWGWNAKSTRSAYYGHISLVIQRESEK